MGSSVIGFGAGWRELPFSFYFRRFLFSSTKLNLPLLSDWVGSLPSMTSRHSEAFILSSPGRSKLFADLTVDYSSCHHQDARRSRETERMSPLRHISAGKSPTVNRPNCSIAPLSSSSRDWEALRLLNHDWRVDCSRF